MPQRRKNLENSPDDSLEKTSITIPAGLIKWGDAYAKDKGFSNFSNLVAQLLKAEKKRTKPEAERGKLPVVNLKAASARSARRAGRTRKKP